MGVPYILLDRDGVINTYRPGNYVNSVEDFSFIEGSLAALVRLEQAGYRVIVISNQAGVGKGLLTVDVLASITRRLEEETVAAGGRIAEVIYCMHAPDEGCDCRKPRPGMILEAARRHGFRVEDTYFIGDSRTDIEAAHAAGCRPCLVLSGQPAGLVSAWPVQPEFMADNLWHAVDQIL